MIDSIKKFGCWVIRVAIWLWEAKIVWITLLLSIIVVLFFWYMLIGTWEVGFRYTGLTLELFGIFTVAYGLKETLNLFEQTFTESFKEFIKFRDNSPVVVSMKGQSELPALTSSGLGTPLAPNSSTEERVTFLEELLNQVRLQAHENRTNVENGFKKLTDALNTERSEREASVEKVQQALKKFAVDGLAIELMGVVWLFFGAISATLSKELACLVQHSSFGELLFSLKTCLGGSFPALLIC